LYIIKQYLKKGLLDGYPEFLKAKSFKGEDETKMTFPES